MTKSLHSVLALLAAFTPVVAQTCPVVPYDAAVSIDRTIEDAIQEGNIPGAVVIVGHSGQVIYRKAYGDRSLVPVRTPMTVDTIFDAASLTKVVATVPAVMKL